MSLFIPKTLHKWTASEDAAIRAASQAYDQALIEQYKALAGPMLHLTKPPLFIQHALKREQQREEDAIKQKLHSGA
jgi:hypothetical protein